MTSLQDIETRLRAALPDLKSRYPIRSLSLFGSYVRGEQNEASDLDVLLDYARPMSFFTLSELKSELERLAGVDVDLVLKSTPKARIGDRISREAMPL